MVIESLLAAGLRHIGKRTMRLRSTPGVQLPRPSSDAPGFLYLHVPFCEQLCPFCPFHRIKLEAALALDYYRALRAEIRRLHRDGFSFSGVYVGGGTPTVLPGELGETLALVRELFPVEEISVETNPNHLEEGTLSILRSVGVNRLSVGVQSFDDRLLREMGRFQSYGSAAQTIERLQATRGMFDTLNADLIFNLPHQSEASLDNDIRVLLETGCVDQVSYYPLMTSPSSQATMKKAMGTVSFRREKAFYYRIVDGLSGVFRPTSVWCFSRIPAQIDEYIVSHEEYVGAGSGSFSYLGGSIYANTFSIGQYIRLSEAGEPALVASKRFSQLEQMGYDFLVKLFGLDIDTRTLETKYGSWATRGLRGLIVVFRLLGAL